MDSTSATFFTMKLNELKLSSERKSGPADMDDNDFEYTPRERRMMEKMMKEIRELLMVDIKSYVSTHLKAARSLHKPQ